MIQRFGFVVGLVFVMSGFGPAQEFVTLDDGSVVEAKVVKKGGDLRLVSVFGERVVQPQQVRSREPRNPAESEFQSQLAELPESFTAGRAALARWCFEHGLFRRAKELLDAIFKNDIDEPAARALVAQIAESWKLDAMEDSERVRDQNAMSELVFERLAPKGATEAVLASEKVLRMPKEQVFRRALKGLKHETPWVRWMSARVLAPHRNEPERIRPLFKRALIDPALAVRREAVRGLKVTGDPVFVRLFAKNLANPTEAFRIHAAEALGELEMKEGIEPLLAALQDSWRPVRNFVASTTQTAYVKDFDVEIAQAAVIADPIVDVVQEGAVLDVAVVGVSFERAAFANSLSRLTGANLGTDPDAWRRYLEKR